LLSEWNLKILIITKSDKFNFNKTFSHLQVIGELERVAPLGNPGNASTHTYLILGQQNPHISLSFNPHGNLSNITRTYPHSGKPSILLPSQSFNSWDNTSLGLLSPLLDTTRGNNSQIGSQMHNPPSPS